MKKELTTIPERHERFRTVKERFMYFPEGIDVNKLALKGYVCGERTDTTTGLSFEHFDCISYLTCSENQQTKEPFIKHTDRSSHFQNGNRTYHIHLQKTFEHEKTGIFRNNQKQSTLSDSVC